MECLWVFQCLDISQLYVGPSDLLFYFMGGYWSSCLPVCGWFFFLFLSSFFAQFSHTFGSKFYWRERGAGREFNSRALSSNLNLLKFSRESTSFFARLTRRWCELSPTLSSFDRPKRQFFRTKTPACKIFSCCVHPWQITHFANLIRIATFPHSTRCSRHGNQGRW